MPLPGNEEPECSTKALRFGKSVVCKLISGSEPFKLSSCAWPCSGSFLPCEARRKETANFDVQGILVYISLGVVTLFSYFFNVEPNLILTSPPFSHQLFSSRDSASERCLLGVIYLALAAEVCLPPALFPEAPFYWASHSKCLSRASHGDWGGGRAEKLR